MKWTITNDLISRGEDAGKSNYRGAPESLPHQFRLLDDDGEVYYLGRSDDNSSESAFQPLDWAMSHAGCTMIEYRNGGKWEQL